MATEADFTINVNITQLSLDVNGEASFDTSSTITTDVTQDALQIVGSVELEPSISAVITFGRWFKGDKGDTGDDGKSAYEIWLEQGHTGSEDDFLEWLKADSAQADWDESNSDDPAYVNNRTHYIDYGHCNQYDVVEYCDDDDILYGENIINFIFSGNEIPGFADWADCYPGDKELRWMDVLIESFQSMTIGGSTVFADGVQIRHMPNNVFVDQEEGLSKIPLAGNLKVYIQYVLSQGMELSPGVDINDFDTGEDFAFLCFWGIHFLTDNPAYGLDGVNHPSVSFVINVPSIVKLPEPFLPNISASKIAGLARVATSGSYNDLLDKPNINANAQYGTTDYWNSRIGYIPQEGAIIVYSDYHSEVVDGQTVYYPGIKIGTGNGYVQDLVFCNEDDSNKLLAHLQDNTRHITALERTFWNDKLNVDDNEETIGETLIFNRN